jgi:uncharacterized protein
MTHHPEQNAGATPAGASDAADGLRPGWPEMSVAIIVYMSLVLGIGVTMALMPADQSSLRGIFGMLANGVAGTLALLAAFAIRLRDLRAFGFRRTTGRWLLMAAGLGLIGFGLSFVIEGVYFSFMPAETTQDDFVAAATGGLLPFLTLLVTGALFTPIGEEVVFRGVIANGLCRYGLWTGVVLSAAIFAVAHGFNVILLDAFMIGLVTGWVFWKTRSIFPGLVIHVVYNALHVLNYSTFNPA